jgi:hypothetical protein
MLKCRNYLRTNQLKPIKQCTTLAPLFSTIARVLLSLSSSILPIITRTQTHRRHEARAVSKIPDPESRLET